MKVNFAKELITYFENKVLLEKLKEEKLNSIKLHDYVQAALLKTQEDNLQESIKNIKMQFNLFLENFENDIYHLDFNLSELKEIFYISDLKENLTFKEWFNSIIKNLKEQLEINKKECLSAYDFKKAEDIRGKLRILSKYNL